MTQFDYERLKEVAANDREREVIDAILAHGNHTRASHVVGLHRSNVDRLVTRLNDSLPKVDKARTGDAPYVIKGKSTLRDRNGEIVAEWTKTRLDGALKQQAIEQHIRWLANEATGLSPYVAPPAACDTDLLVVYPLGDPHFGLYSWADETGDNFDLKMADEITRAAIDRLVSSAPAATTGLLLNLGDALHADDSTNATPGHGNLLDVDGRYGKVMQVAARSLIHCTLRLLEKHEKVIVWNLPGNHDPHSAFALALAMSMFFENEPRVTVDTSSSLYRYLRFGKNLIGSHHGHGAKGADLPLLMATDRAEDWGATEFRTWLCGHIHHRTAKEHPGCSVETFRTLAGKDAWHAGKGYRSGRDSYAITYHREWGETQRTRCDLSRLVSAQPKQMADVA